MSSLLDYCFRLESVYFLCETIFYNLGKLAMSECGSNGIPAQASLFHTLRSEAVDLRMLWLRRLSADLNVNIMSQIVDSSGERWGSGGQDLMQAPARRGIYCCHLWVFFPSPLFQLCAGRKPSPQGLKKWWKWTEFCWLSLLNKIYFPENLLWSLRNEWIIWTRLL